jgi:hypothetical protein
MRWRRYAGGDAFLRDLGSLIDPFPIRSLAADPAHSQNRACDRIIEPDPQDCVGIVSHTVDRRGLTAAFSMQVFLHIAPIEVSFTDSERAPRRFGKSSTPFERFKIVPCRFFPKLTL